jgi:hypothetical protein
MPKPQHYMTISAEDGSFNNGTVSEDFRANPPPTVASPKRSEHHTDESLRKEHTAGVAAGRLPEEVYTNTLPWWRVALRRKCVEVVEWESEVIAKWQVRPFPPLLHGAQTMRRRRADRYRYRVSRRCVSGRLG